MTAGGQSANSGMDLVLTLVSGLPWMRSGTRIGVLSSVRQLLVVFGPVSGGVLSSMPQSKARSSSNVLALLQICLLPTASFDQIHLAVSQLYSSRFV